MNRSIRLVMLVLILLFSLLMLKGMVFAGDWGLTDKGYKVWNANPQLDKTVTWSGKADSKGYVTGNGVLQWLRNGKPYEKYEGEMLQGKRNGKGIFNYANGERYEGDWVDDKRNGQGKLVYKEGGYSVGGFSNDQQDGYTVTYFPDGEVMWKGTYKGGDFYFETPPMVPPPISSWNWVYVTKVDLFKMDYYIDTQTVVRDGDTLYYWERTVDENLMFGVKTSISRCEAKLTNPRKKKVLETYNYDVNGKQVGSNTEPKKNFNELPPGSVGEAVINKALQYSKIKSP